MRARRDSNSQPTGFSLAVHPCQYSVPSLTGGRWSTSVEVRRVLSTLPSGQSPIARSMAARLGLESCGDVGSAQSSVDTLPVRFRPRWKDADHAEAISEGVPRQCRGRSPPGPGAVDPDREALRDLRDLLVELAEGGRHRGRQPSRPDRQGLPAGARAEAAQPAAGAGERGPAAGAPVRVPVAVACRVLGPSAQG
jgi:hypothetical protein